MYGRSGSRQQPGYACEECRKKKLRCDRQQPQCGACATAGISCRVNKRATPRTSQKGSLKALRGRIGELERQLSSLESSEVVEIDPAVPDLEELELLHLETSDEGQSTNVSSSNTSGTKDSGSSFESPIFSNFMFEPIVMQSLLPYHPFTTDDLQISDLMKADLTQLYFDRVHSIIPMLDQAKVAQLAKDRSPMSEHRQCLQYAMWTLAITFSSQFGNIRETMYSKTRAALEALDLKDSDMKTCNIEQIQSWILLTFYEFTKCSYRLAWLSAGRVFRLVQLARLDKLDSTTKNLEMDQMEIEEKRRTFWVAYCLDRFISVSHGAPITLSEDAVFTRLPCSDYEFNNGPASPGPFLSEVMTSVASHATSPLSECVIFVTICSRALAHKQVTDMEALYGDSPKEFAFRHDWLNSLLTSRFNNLKVNYPPVSLASDPMIFFTHLVARTAIIYLCYIMEPLSSDVQTFPSASTQLERGVRAAQEISCLAGELEHIGYFKAHTFTSLPIYLSAAKLRYHLERQKTQLQSNPSSLHEIEESLQASLGALRNLRSVNNLADYYLHMVEADKISDICFRPE